MAHPSGEAAAYYNQPPDGPNGHGPGPQMGYPQPKRQHKAPHDPNQPPPYGQQAYQAPQAGAGPYTFDQAFTVERPKWNDLWAGILVRLAPLPLASVPSHKVPLTHKTAAPPLRRGPRGGVRHRHPGLRHDARR